MEYKFNLKLPSPMLMADLILDYEEVKQASGVSYILLLFISESKDRNELLSRKLCGIGVPNRLHFIFAQELTRMCDRAVISMTDGRIFQENNFDSYCIDDFELTEKGYRLLKNGAMPTGQIKQKKLKLGYGFSDKKINFFNNFRNVMTLSGGNGILSGKEVTDCLEGLGKPDFDTDEMQNHINEFCESHKLDSEIGFFKKEEINAVGIQSFNYCFGIIPAVMTVDTEKLAFSVNTANEDYDQYILSYLSGNDISSVISVFNGTDGIKKMLNDAGKTEALKFSDIPASRIRNFSFELKPVAADTKYVIVSEEFWNASFPENSKYQVKPCSMTLLKDVNLSPVAIAISAGKEIFGYVPVRDVMNYALSYGPLKNAVFDLCTVAVCSYEYGEIRQSLINYVKGVLDNDMDSGYLTMTELFGIFDDVESCCMVIGTDTVLSGERMDYLAGICRKLGRDKSSFASRLKAELKRILWEKIYGYVQDKMRNHENPKDTIEFFSVRTLIIAECFGIKEMQVLTDFRNISQVKKNSELEQYYYFRSIGFSESAVLTQINPLKNTDIFSLRAGEGNTALDGLLRSAEIIRNMEKDFKVSILSADKNLKRIVWPKDRISDVSARIHELKEYYGEARPLFSIQDEGIKKLRRIIEMVAFPKNEGVSRKGKR